MKKLTLLVGTAILAICLIILSCRKEINNFVDEKSNVPANVLESSKIFYERHATLTESIVAAKERRIFKNPSATGRRRFIRLSPQWKKAKQISENGKTLLVVPTVENRLSTKKIAIRRFFVFDINSGRPSDGEIVEIVGFNYNVSDNADKILASHKQESIQGFSGAILRYDLNYYRKAVSVYENGNKTSKKSDFKRAVALKKNTVEKKSSQSMSTSSSSGGGTGGGVYWYTYQLDDQGNPWNETYTFLYLEGDCSGFPPPDGSGNPNPSGDSNGTDPYNTNSASTDPYSGGGGYGGNQGDIRNKTNNGCISAVVGTLLASNTNIEGKMSEIIKKFDQNKDVTINIFDGVTANGAPGQTTDFSLKDSRYTANITLQTSYFTGTDAASSQSLAAVLIHEVVHAYIKQQNWNTTHAQQHAMIASNYIKPMTEFLVSVYGMSKQDAFSLAWNGVVDSQVFKDAPATDLFTYTYKENNIDMSMSISKQEIINRAVAYNGRTNYADEGVKGTEICPN